MSQSNPNQPDSHPLRPTDRRQAPRHSILSALRATVRIARPDGDGADDFLLSPHDLSTAGVGLWHDRPVYLDTAVTFIASDGSGDAVNGRCVRCKQISERLHEVGVRFDSPIEMRDFLRRFVNPRAGVA